MFIATFALPAALGACQQPETAGTSRFAPTDLAPVMPTGDFAAYIQGARAHTQAVNAAAGTPIAQSEVAAVGPFELRPAPPGQDCKGRATAKYDRGLLLIHGLNDTPFSMWDLGARFAKACYLVRSILLPGHGTVPGDLLKVGLDAWRDAVARGVWSFRGEVDRLVIAGFDLGANLALDAALDLGMPPEVELNGIVMLAPAFDYRPPSFAPAAVAPGGNTLWGDVFDKRSSLRYHSIAKPSIAATNQLGRDLFARDAPAHLPLFMVASAEDAVADASLARAWFCGQRVTPRHLLWYSRYPDAPLPDCSCTVERRGPLSDEIQDCVTARPSTCVMPAAAGSSNDVLPNADNCRTNPYESKNGSSDGAILDLAHIALLAAPENPRYGAGAGFNDCLHYSWQPQTPEGQVCAGLLSGEGDPHLRYGEMNADNLGQYILRRLTYNPDFDHMAEHMIEFLARSN